MESLGLKHLSFSYTHTQKTGRGSDQNVYVYFFPAGVGIGVVDVGYERRLANHLGAHRTPSILGVINGKVTFFHFAVAKEHLRQFVEDLLPQRLVERVSFRNYNIYRSLLKRDYKHMFLPMSLCYQKTSETDGQMLVKLLATPNHWMYIYNG